MNSLNISDRGSRTWDFLALGEVLLRFDPGNDRIETAHTFRVFDGGAEYNVARTLAYVFRQKTAIATSLADNALGRLAENFVRQAGVDPSEIIWRETSGSQDEARNGLYFIERGFGLRPPASCFDRGNTVISKLKTDEIDWREIFERRGATWFHTGGVFSGLSESSATVAYEAMSAARASGAWVSYDLNYRESLWKNRGGRAAADIVNRKLLPLADVVFGVLDFDSRLSQFDEQLFRRSVETMTTEFTNLKICASTLRNVQSASRHDLSAVCLAEGEIFKGKDYANVDVYDRVGSGDAFAAGFIYGLLGQRGFQYSVDCGLANAALTMTTCGDNPSATLNEIEVLMAGGCGTAER